ncbi:hypothetical protein VNI00_015699 [Paramarasmius palmivorus]|uniref:F-box domain-containing protein n=1 Tax=Paramarasmius palmivorus TaxID=297713 RepID=A0AAW0BL36_9AGAR
MVCLSEEPEQSPHSSPDDHSMTPTLTLAHVSHHWRRIVNASPRLWSSIKITVSPTHSVRPLLEHYLTHSKDYPLDLKFSGRFPADDFILRQNLLAYGLMVIDLLSDHCSRIERLTLHEADVFAFLPASSNLSSLKFFRNSKNLIPAEGAVWSILRRAHQLTSVSTDRLLGRNFLPYSRLTALAITDTCNCRQLLATLKICASLQSLEVCNPTFSLHDEEWDLWDHVQLGSLNHFSASAHTDDDIHALFQHLTLPALTSLRVTELAENDEDTLLPIHGLIQRSGCKITELYLNLSWIHASGEDLVDFLELCPNLSRLEVEVWAASGEGQTISYQLLDAIRASYSSPKGMLVPNLVRTKIIERHSSVDEHVVVALLDMMESIFTRRLASSREPSIHPWDLNITFGGPYNAEAVKAWEASEGRLALNGIKCKIAWMRGYDQ